MTDLSVVRAQFPALGLIDEGKPRIHFDNPAGTQVPESVLQAIRDYLVNHNANAHGSFRTSQLSDHVVEEAHQAMADFLNAPSAKEIIFGPNMTSLTFSLSRALAQWIKPGQEIVVTHLDHDANVAPWLRVAEDTGAVIRWLDFDQADCTLCIDQLDELLSEKTFLVAVGYASNLVGTVNPIGEIIRQAHAVGALTYIDAVHYAPHGLIDVQELGADFLVCSPYKFFGPHQGVLWGKEELLEQLPAYRVRPAGSEVPGKFETGTQNHECVAGTLAAVDYLAEVGRGFGSEAVSGEEGQRRHQ
ncbi:MAG: cysteine desulfurase-like protein, partial [Verrucomicrobiae bacterium]|nr:cysteine desulfurase-like protein [Verrucomicrobiae bacterium]